MQQSFWPKKIKTEDTSDEESMFNITKQEDRQVSFIPKNNGARLVRDEKRNEINEFENGDHTH